MSVQKLFGISSIQNSSAPKINNRGDIDTNFVKQTFNFGGANPNKPDGIVYENALGDPPKGTQLYVLW